MPLRLWVLALGCLACSGTRSPPLDGAPTNLQATAAAMYQAYGNDLQGHRREALAGYYHHQGTLLVLEGKPYRLSRAALDTFYRGPWSPPAYFAWDSLAYDSLNANQVLVTGGFRWLDAHSSDTTHSVYTAILDAVDSGLAIRFEQETSWPKP